MNLPVCNFDNVFKFNLFQALLLHSDVVEAAVVGRPDKLKGHIPVGLCVVRSGKIYFPY